MVGWFSQRRNEMEELQRIGMCLDRVAQIYHISQVYDSHLWFYYCKIPLHVISNNGNAGFHPGFFKLGGPASLTSQILYLITTLGKGLTRPFPDVDILLLQ